MSLLLKILAIIIVIIAIVAVCFFYNRDSFWQRLTGSPDLGAYDFQKPRNTHKQNDALVCTQGQCENANLYYQPFAGTKQAFFQALEANIEKSSQKFIRVDDKANDNYRRYVTFSNLMHFPDTTDVEVFDLNDEAGIGFASYGRAKLGVKDFGANKERLKMWFDFLTPATDKQ